jgi:aminoglycoside phosphotransferase (APT) family kinase protein
MPDGEASHATVVADAAGDRSLLKWWQMAGGESDSLEHIERVVPLVERLRARGYPAPRHLLTETAGSLLFVLQELLRGRPPVPLLPVHVEQLVELNRLQEEQRIDGDGWGAFLRRTLVTGADGYCLHDPLRRHSPAGAALLDRVIAIGEATDPAALPVAGIAHFDFHHLNVLAEGERITGIVDCEGARAGDPCFDLVTLLYCSAEGGLGEDDQLRLWRLLRDRREAATLRAYLAHMALRLSSWSAVHHDDATTERWLAHSQMWLDRAG